MEATASATQSSSLNRISHLPGNNSRPDAPWKTLARPENAQFCTLTQRHLFRETTPILSSSDEAREIFSSAHSGSISSGKISHLSKLFKNDVDARAEILSQTDSLIKALREMKLIWFQRHELVSHLSDLLVSAHNDKSVLASTHLIKLLSENPDASIISDVIKSIPEPLFLSKLYRGVHYQHTKMGIDAEQPQFAASNELLLALRKMLKSAVRTEDVDTLSLLAFTKTPVSDEAYGKFIKLASNGKRDAAADTMSRLLCDESVCVPDEAVREVASVLTDRKRNIPPNSMILGDITLGACRMFVSLSDIGDIDPIVASRFRNEYLVDIDKILGNGHPEDKKVLAASAKEKLSAPLENLDNFWYEIH